MGGNKIIVNDFSGIYKGNFKRKCILGYGRECLMAALHFMMIIFWFQKIFWCEFDLSNTDFKLTFGMLDFHLKVKGYSPFFC